MRREYGRRGLLLGVRPDQRARQMAVAAAITTLPALIAASLAATATLAATAGL